MNTPQKHLAALAVASAAALAVLPGAWAQDDSDAARLDALFVELAEPDRTDWERVEGEIIRLWSRSGSVSMDLLLRRGNEAMENENYEQALEHLSALVDHAPQFAEGWNARATVYFLLGEYTLSISDVEHVLALEPRHFGALAGLGFMFEEMGDNRRALAALLAARSINPNRTNISESINRLERETGAADL